MNTPTSKLAEELVPLNAQIDKVQQERETHTEALQVVEAELAKYALARQRFEALRQVCDAFDTLGELKADQLFWKGVPGGEDAATHVSRARSRVSQFEQQISGIVEKQASLNKALGRCDEMLEFLYDDVQDAYEREEERQEEFVIEREPTPLPF